MPGIPFLYFLFRKGQQAGPSRASLRYQEAMLYGTPAEKLRERFRRAIRELFAFWILPILPIMLYLEGPRKSEEQAVLQAILIAGIFCIPLWLFYRLVRFALGR